MVWPPATLSTILRPTDPAGSRYLASGRRAIANRCRAVSSPSDSVDGPSGVQSTTGEALVAVKVSAVIPVYNPGNHIDDCIASLLRQSLPDDEYEAIFVDDGSTDGTGARLDALAAEHPQVQVIHIPNSGWPGRPRNVGTDAAQGEFVYYIDNDDWIGDQALERLYATAQRTGADIVIGKVVGQGRSIPKGLFRRNRDDAVLGREPLLSLLTPHKLFRRQFLIDNGLRYPEGKVRLEDHLFVVPAYFRASRIAILADYPCYNWVRRVDDTNASSSGIEPVSYFRSVRHVLDIVEAETEPGPFRDSLLAHWFSGKCLGRLGGRTIFAFRKPHLRKLHTEIHRLALERFSPDVDQHLTPTLRVRAAVLRRGTLDDLLALASWERGIRAECDLLAVEPAPTGVLVRAEARLTYGDGSPVRFERRGDRLLWSLPVTLSTSVPEAARDMTEPLRAARADVVVRHRNSGADWLVRGTHEAELDELGGDTVALRVRAEGVLAPKSGAAGARMPRGLWDVDLRLAACGWTPQARLRGGAVSLPVTAQGADRRAATAYVTANGNLSLAVGRMPPGMEPPLDPLGAEAGGAAPAPATASSTTASSAATSKPSPGAAPVQIARDALPPRTTPVGRRTARVRKMQRRVSDQVKSSAGKLLVRLRGRRPGQG